MISWIVEAFKMRTLSVHTLQLHSYILVPSVPSVHLIVVHLGLSQGGQDLACAHCMHVNLQLHGVALQCGAAMQLRA